MTIEQDIPLSDINQDEFGRGTMVDLIVKSINQTVTNDHPCLVYGIYGKWGEGKTSLMNFIKNELLSQGDDDGIDLVEFNPWLLGNDESLLKEFFKTIMTSRDDIVREALEKYGSLAIFASETVINTIVPGSWGSVLAKGIKWTKKILNDGKDTLAELKKKASEAIVNSKRHLIVMIDDVDRLDKEELHTLLRIIRQVADFKNCIYIVAMDVDMVSKSIGDYHGDGSSIDGRKFLDKIVNVPICIPMVPLLKMREIVEKQLTAVLNEYSDEQQIKEIVKSISSFFQTYRELKRYCNQLEFVLPHLKDEVNIKDLCILEAIKITNKSSYDSIFERRSHLFRELDGVQYHIMGKEKADKQIKINYEEACDYVVEELKDDKKGIVRKAVNELFEDKSFDYQQDLDKKRIITHIYFNKYFSLSVPSDIIPDRLINELEPAVKDGVIDHLSMKLNMWLDNYSVSEIMRVALYLIRQHNDRGERCQAASVLAKAFTNCNVAKEMPPYLFPSKEDVTFFVPNQIIYRYMFAMDDKSARMEVVDKEMLDDTYAYIFKNGEINYCMHIVSSSDEVFDSSCYNGDKVLPIIIERYEKLSFNQQFAYGKYLLLSLLRNWKRVDEKSFNDYANSLFTDLANSYKVIFNKFINHENDANDVNAFVGLFKSQITIINERLEKESDEVRECRSVMIYASNYRTALNNGM